MAAIKRAELLSSLPAWQTITRSCNSFHFSFQGHTQFQAIVLMCSRYTHISPSKICYLQLRRPEESCLYARDHLRSEFFSKIGRGSHNWFKLRVFFNHSRKLFWNNLSNTMHYMVFKKLPSILRNLFTFWFLCLKNCKPVPIFDTKIIFKLTFTFLWSIFIGPRCPWSDLCVRMSGCPYTLLRLNWCDSGWWGYQLNTNW